MTVPSMGIMSPRSSASEAQNRCPELSWISSADRSEEFDQHGEIGLCEERGSPSGHDTSDEVEGLGKFRRTGGSEFAQSEERAESDLRGSA